MAHVLGYALLSALLAAAVGAAGLAVERTLFRGGFAPAMRPLAVLVLGIGLWVAALFALAQLGLLGATALAFVATAVVLAAALGLARGGGGAAPDVTGEGAASRATGVAVATALSLPMFVVALSPAVSWDAAVYHLTLPRLYLAAGGFRPVELSVYSHWPQNVELLYAAAMLVRDHVLAKLVHFAFAIATLFALRLACRGRGRPAAAWLAMVLLLANAVVIFEAHSAYVDLASAFFFLAGFLLVVEASREADARALVAAGIAAGLLAGTKVTGIVGAAILGVLYLAFRRPRGARELRRVALCFGLPLAAAWLPWLLHSFSATGNPVYPFFYGWFGGPDWSPALGEAFHRWQASIGMGRGPLDYVLLPLRVILDGAAGYDRFDGSIGAFWIVVLPLTALGGMRDVFVRRCLGASALYFACWALQSQQMRFLVPVLPLLSLAAALTLHERLRAVADPRLRSRLAAALLVLVAAAVAWQQRALWADASRVLDGYRGDVAAFRRQAVYPELAFANEHLPADARVLFLNTNQGFFCEREYLADSFFEASQIAAWLGPAGADVERLQTLLAERGVTHVLLDRWDWGIVYPPALAGLLGDPRRVRPLYETPDGRITLYELRGPGDRGGDAGFLPGSGPGGLDRTAASS